MFVYDNKTSNQCQELQVLLIVTRSVINSDVNNDQFHNRVIGMYTRVIVMIVNSEACNDCNEQSWET